MRDAGDISRALAERALELCRELLPAGVREGAEWRCGSLGGERGHSLGVRLFGSKAAIWSDFSTGQAGDGIDLIAAVRCGGDKGAALRWATAWLGMPAEDRAERLPPEPGCERRSPEIDAEATKRQKSAANIFYASEPKLAGTLVNSYLKGRGIDLSLLGRQPRALRYNKSLWNAESGRRWPAMVAAITDASGEMIGIHRSWLAQDPSGAWRKAPLESPKRSLGKVSGGTIRLWRGKSGKPLAQAPDGDVVVIAEGIETALSIAIAAPEFRVLAAVSLGNISKIELPPAITTVIIAADNDLLGGPAEAALFAAAAALQRPGRVVRIARSPVGSDFNDCLNG